MALGKKSGGSIIISTFNGSFTRKVSEDTEGAEKRTNKNGDEVHELHYDSISGFINKAEYVKREKNDNVYHNLNVHISDGPEKYMLSLSLSGKVAQVFFQTMYRIDFTKEVTFNIWTAQENGKKKTAAFISQEDEPLKWTFTKEKPNGKPDWEKSEDALGKVEWSRAKELRFFLDHLEQKVQPKIEAAQPEQKIVDVPEPELVADLAGDGPGNFPTVGEVEKKGGKVSGPLADPLADPTGDGEDDDLPF